MSNLSEKIASKLFDSLRIARKSEEQNSERRWRMIKSDEYISLLQGKELPPNIRFLDGIYQMDITSTKYDNLSPDLQEECKQAGLVVASILESENDYSSNIVGHIIHENWLRRNSWAKADPVLSCSFSELPKKEQDKVMNQYFIGLQEKFGAYQSQEELFADLMKIKKISQNPTRSEEINFYAEVLTCLQRAEKLLYSINTVKLSQILSEKGCEKFKDYYAKRNMIAPNISVSKSLQTSTVIFPLTVFTNIISTERQTFVNGVDKAFSSGFDCSWVGQWLENNAKISRYSARQIDKMNIEKQYSQSL